MARLIVVLALVATTAAGATPADRLSEAHDRYQRIASSGGWPTVPDGPLVRPGEADASQIPVLRRRLAAEGALMAGAPAGDVLDGDLAEALAATQDRYGLSPDGILGPRTRAALNAPAGQRARQIRVALDSLAALNLPGAGRWILVNVPDYRVRAFEDGRQVLQMRAVVGADRDGWRTPLFSDEVEYLEFRPVWNVPTAIAREELAP
ncbi:MAG: peptidoglycan-binding protein, partial [Bacteroidota bacterium]